jgi:hypothetical protein
MMQGIPDTVKFDLEKSKGESTSEFSGNFPQLGLSFLSQLMEKTIKDMKIWPSR